jgi:hypothetical protein
LFNFRDLGGLPAAGERAVRAGVLYRSATLSWLDESEHGRFADTGIRTVIDLRRREEVADQGAAPVPAGCRYRNIELSQEPWPEVEFVSTPERVRYLAERYAELAEEAQAALAEAIRVISQPELAAVLVHCVAGRDRTGVLIAIILALLDVPDEVIGSDYARSEDAEDLMMAYYLSRNPGLVVPPRPAGVLAAPAAAIELFLAGLRDRHGSLDGYASAIGVSAADLARMRDHLLGRPGRAGGAQATAARR